MDVSNFLIIEVNIIINLSSFRSLIVSGNSVISEYDRFNLTNNCILASGSGSLLNLKQLHNDKWRSLESLPMDSEVW